MEETPMNAVAESMAATLPQFRISERRVFVLLAALFVVLTLAGFVPSSMDKIQAVQAGQRPPFPPILHVHAALMGAWLLLLLAQSALMAAGRRALHRVLGFAGAAVLAAIIVSGVLLIADVWNGLWGPAAAVMPEGALAETRSFVTNILLLQARALVVFPLFVVWGLWLRRRDPDAHQRMMLLGTAVPVVAGLDRLATALGWPTVPPALDVYLLVSVLPLLLWDAVHHRRIHAATRAWLAVNLPLAALTWWLWDSPWWLAVAPRLMGVG
jgi:hypothetical protein